MLKIKTLAGRRNHFPFALFSLEVVGQVVLLLLALRFGWPQMWRQQLSAGWLAIGLTFLGVHLFACFFEFFFHRYVLHTISIYLLQPFTRKHRVHHALTKVVRTRSKTGGLSLVENCYPFTEDEQLESAIFPPYALAAFWGVFSPLLFGLQWLWPNLPMLLGGYLAIAWSFYLYETWHAIEHLPYEDWWQPHMDRPRSGRFFRWVYGFHLLHHAVPQCNEAISGFFAFPVADWIFKTYKSFPTLLLDGSVAHDAAFTPPSPCRLIAWLDRLATRREAAWKQRHQQKYLKVHR